VRLGAAAASSSWKNSRDSASSGSRVSVAADHAAISAGVCRFHWFASIHARISRLALARGELGLQRLGIDAGEFEEPLVVRAGVVILAVRTRKRGAAFVEHSRKQGVAAETLPRTARRTLSEVGRGELCSARCNCGFSVHGCLSVLV
jgi:hypothetical protein